jgi:hypothetical protein
MPDGPHLTTIGQRPGFVFAPTRQRQAIRPPVFGPSPVTLDATVPYMTSIVQRARGETLTVSDA